MEILNLRKVELSIFPIYLIQEYEAKNRFYLDTNSQKI